MDYTKKEHLYKTAQIKGLHRCFVGIIEHNDEKDTYLCRIGGTLTTKWFHASELKQFCL